MGFSFTLRSFEAAEIAPQTLNVGNNVEVKQFECWVTGMQFFNLRWSTSALRSICSLLPFSALRLRWGFLRQFRSAAFVFGSLFHKE
jgi:hypothetical protein